MSRNLILAAALALASPAVAQDATDGPGPNLVIEVAGAANGTVVIDLFSDTAPLHAAQITALAKAGAYDNVVFHRVIDGFMAQTGDVMYGKAGTDNSMAGMGDSEMPNIPAEFSTELSFQRGMVGMARAGDPACGGDPTCPEGQEFLDSANSQFFIMFAPGEFLDGHYTIVGQVISGMDDVDAIQRGEPPATPDVMTKVTVQE